MIGSSAADIKTIGIIGAGTIGSSWAAYFLATGRAVHAWDPAEGSEKKIRAFVDNAWPALEALGVVVNGASPDKLTVESTAAAAAGPADFIQESAPERLDVKLALYKDFEPAVRPEVVISTSTSGLLMSDLQKDTQHPERFVLGHPFNPPHLIPLVEVLGGSKTDPAVVDWTVDFYNAIGKKAIKLFKEVPGHVANRMQAAIWREAIHLAQEGVASVEDRLWSRHPLGPDGAEPDLPSRGRRRRHGEFRRASWPADSELVGGSGLAQLHRCREEDADRRRRRGNQGQECQGTGGDSRQAVAGGAESAERNRVRGRRQ